MLSSYTDQLRSDDVKTVPDDEGNDGPSSFETPEMTYTTEFITMQSITGIVHSKMSYIIVIIYLHTFVSFQNHYLFPHENKCNI